MTTATQMYALGLDQIATAIKVGGNKRTVLVQGHMGTGKSSLLNVLTRELPKHTACYFDCTTKDLGDITIPKLATVDDAGYVTYVTNEELGVHLGKPIVLMIDEYGKANPAVKNALLRLMLERKIGSYTLHPDSLVFATTNLGAEGVGDLLPPHARNRMTVINARKPSNIEWIEWGINNGIDHSLLGWAKDNPQLFASFEDVREHIDDQTLTGLLMGTVGNRGAMDLMAFVKLADQLPSLDSIKQTPDTALVPSSAAAICMVVYRALATMERDWVDAWMTYLVRLDPEAQGMFANGVRAPKYSKQSVVMTNRKFTDWAMAHNYMFAADKK